MKEKKIRRKALAKYSVLLLIITIAFSLRTPKESYAYDSIVYNDNGMIELYADDLSRVNPEEYDKVSNVTFRTFMPDEEDINIFKSLKNVKQVYFMGIDPTNLLFLNEIHPDTNMEIYFIKTTVDVQNINNPKIVLISFADSVVKNFKDIENLTNLQTISFGDCDGYEKLDYTKFPNLHSLFLMAYIDDFEGLINSIPNVTNLSLGGTNIQNKDTQYLKRLSNLTELNLHQTYLTDIDFVSDLPNLENLVLPLSVTDLSPLYNLPNLQSVFWDGYTELFVTPELVDYLDRNNINHYDFDPNIKDTISSIAESLNITNDDPKDILDKITRYIISNTGTDLEGTNSNSSGLDIIINEKEGVCYNHSLAVYTLAKYLGVDDIYYSEGILMRLTDIHVGNQYNDSITHDFYEAHAWNIVNIDGVWYGLDAAQMNRGNYILDEDLYNANFLKNPFEDGDYEYNYALENYYDFNYFFYARHLETDGILKQTQTFEFKDISGLNIKNHVIYDFDTNDTEASNICNRVLDNYQCSYEDVDSSGNISTGDKIIITKKDVVIDTFTINTGSYSEPQKVHLGKINMSYANYPNEEIINFTTTTKYFNDSNPLELTIKGDNFDDDSSYSSRIEIINYAKNEKVYSKEYNLNGKSINDGFTYLINSSDLVASKHECGKYGCDPDYIINIYVDDMVRTQFLLYEKVEKTKYTISIAPNNKVTYSSNTFIPEENEDAYIKLSGNKGYIISSIKVNGIESIDDYKDNQLIIKNITQDINVVVETTPESYSFIEGMNSKYQNKKMIFKVNGPLEIFEKLFVNGEELPPSNYILESGSTIITLTNDYLKTLPSGTYKLTAKYTNGTMTSTSFIIEKNKQNVSQKGKNNLINLTNNPKTNDLISTYILSMFVSFIIFVMTCVNLKKKDTNK